MALFGARSSRRQKQITCFGSRIGSINGAIDARARMHNRHIVTSRPHVSELLNWIVPPGYRKFCQDVWHNFNNEIDAGTRRANVALPEEIPFGDGVYQSPGMSLEFDWRNATCEEDSDCFVLPPHLRNVKAFTSDTPKAFLDMITEWQTNAIEWGLVRKVVDWLDDTLAPNDFVQACYLLPMLPSLVKHISDGRAIVQAAGSVPRNPMRVDLPWLLGLQRANQILAGSELMGEADTELSSPVDMVMKVSGNTVHHPLWPSAFDAEYTAQY